MAEKCYVCAGKGSFLHLSRLICKKCFLKNIEKRVKKHLGRRIFKKDDRIMVIGEVEKRLLENAVKGMPLQIKAGKSLPKERERFDFIVIGKTLDEVNREFLQDLFQGKLNLGRADQGKFSLFNILEPLTDQEVSMYCRINKIKTGIEEKKEILKLFDEYQELKYNIYNTIKELRESF